MSVVRQAVLMAAVVIAGNPVFAGEGKTGASYAAQYEGGTAGLKQHRTVKAFLSDDAVVLVQYGRRVAVLIQRISEISCATNLRRRFGASVLGRVPLVALDKEQTHYVGVSWTDENGAGADRKHGDVVFKVSSGEYGQFVAALERLTGKQAVDTKATPTVVRYE